MINANDEEVMLEDNLEEDESGNDEGDSEQESEEQSHEEEGGDTDSETVTISKTDLDKLKREAFAAKRLREKKDDKGSKESTETEFDKEMIERTFIAVHAKVDNQEAQDEVMRLAKKFGMSVAEAVKDPDVKLRIENIQKQAKARQAIAGQTGSGKNNNRGIDYHVEQYKTKGVLPSDPSTVAKILEKMAS
jgi:hypothetical protein